MTNPGPPDFGFGDTPEGRVFKELRRLRHEEQTKPLLELLPSGDIKVTIAVLIERVSDLEDKVKKLEANRG